MYVWLSFVSLILSTQSTMERILTVVCRCKRFSLISNIFDLSNLQNWNLRVFDDLIICLTFSWLGYRSSWNTLALFPLEKQLKFME